MMQDGFASSVSSPEICAGGDELLRYVRDLAFFGLDRVVGVVETMGVFPCGVHNGGST